jgi:hypothetical protein
MTSAPSTMDRRKFGRRESSICGEAIIARQSRKAFKMTNISAGGAHLVFEDGFVPPASFRIEVTGTKFALSCEVRHQGRHGVGVKFTRRTESDAFARHFQLMPVAEVRNAELHVQPRTALPVPTVSGRNLRATLQLPGFVNRQPPKLDDAPAPASQSADDSAAPSGVVLFYYEHVPEAPSVRLDQVAS